MSRPPQLARSPPPQEASASRPTQPTLPGFLVPQDEADRLSSPPSASEMARALTPHHFPPPRCSPPEMAHNGAPLHRHLRSSPRPYKRCLSTLPPSHRPGVLPLSFPPLLSSIAITAIVELTATGEMPLHHLPTHSDPAVELNGPSFPSPAPWPELSGTRAAGDRAPVCSRAWQWPQVHGGTVAPWSTPQWTESTDFFIQK
jgi:hypothetical protein